MFKHSSKMLILALLSCASPSAYAGVVSADDARQMADEFFSASRKGGLASDRTLELVYTAGSPSKPVYYVFHATDGKGFVIVSADDCTTPVLGYSFENPYVVSKVPPAMRWMMSGVEKEIKAASGLQKAQAAPQRRMAVRAAAPGRRRRLCSPLRHGVRKGRSTTIFPDVRSWDVSERQWLP